MKRRAKVALLGVLLALAECGAGCGGQAPDAQDAHDAVRYLDAVRAFIVEACREPDPAMPRERCDEAVAAFNALPLVSP